MNMSGYNVPEPCFGIGVEELVNRWIDLERAQEAAGMSVAARATKMMRRQLQEAADLVADPERLIPPTNTERANPEKEKAMETETGTSVGVVQPPFSVLRIEQPYEIQAGDIWYFQTFVSHSGAIGGQHIPKAEVERRLEAQAGPGQLIQIEGAWHWQLASKSAESK